MKKAIIYLLLVIVCAFGCSRSRTLEMLPQGRLELVWAANPEGAEEEPWFANIGDVAVHQDQVYVLDADRKTILVLDENGSFVKTIGRPGNGPGEFGLAPDRIAVSTNGDVYANLSAFRISSFNRYTSGGDFIELIEHSSLVSEASFFPMELAAVVENSLIYQGSGREGAATSEVGHPLFLDISGDTANPIVDSWISEQAERSRTGLIRDERLQHIWPFTGGYSCLGPEMDELLFIKWSDPYTIHRIQFDGTTHSFGFVNIERDRRTLIAQDTGGLEYRLGGYMTGYQQGRPMAYFTWTHWLLGIAKYGNNLVVFTEVLETGEWKQYIYLVDLLKERATLVASANISTTNWPGPYLRGAFENGVLIFSVFDPAPGIITYRIVEQ
ncbi:MAG: 6-bladed beta-propeller [Candidatus Thorarchaeota archaeon]